MKVFVLAEDFDYEGMGEAEAAFSEENLRERLTEYFEKIYPLIADNYAFEGFINDLIISGDGHVLHATVFRLTPLEMDNV